MNQTYLDTAKALVAAAPHVFFDDTFALKGGTAINLFFRDMPRLSVDLGACRIWGVESENRPQRGQFLPDLQAHSPAMGQNEVSVKTHLYSSDVATKKTVRAKRGVAKNGPLRSICSRRFPSPTGS